MISGKFDKLEICYDRYFIHETRYVWRDFTNVMDRSYIGEIFSKFWEFILADETWPVSGSNHHPLDIHGFQNGRHHTIPFQACLFKPFFPGWRVFVMSDIRYSHLLCRGWNGRAAIHLPKGSVYPQHICIISLWHMWEVDMQTLLKMARRDSHHTPFGAVRFTCWSLHFTLVVVQLLMLV